MRSAPTRTRLRGFTLLEVMTALLLMAAIISMVFGIARTSLKLSKSIVDSQNEEMRQQAFFDLLRRRFSSLPGNTRLDLRVEESGRQYLSNLTLQEVPMSFTWGGEERIAKAVQLSTVQRRSGFLDIVLRYYENEILEGSAATFGGQNPYEDEPFAEMVLLRDVAYFEWRVLNAVTMEWQYEWADRSRLPLQVELVMSVGASGESMRHVFWLPPKMNPELVMRQLHAGGGETGGNPSDPGSGNPGSPDPGIPQHDPVRAIRRGGGQ